MNNNQQRFPTEIVLIGAVLLTFWFSGGQEWLQRFLNPDSSPAAVATITPQYEAPPPEATKNSPEGDYFNDHIKKEVPEEEKWRVDVADLFSLDSVLMNQYFDLSVYKDVNAKIEVGTYVRPRAAERYTALVWPTNFWTKLTSVDGEILDGSMTSTIIAADVFLTVGTSPGAALDGITKVDVVDNTINITSEIKLQALLAGIPISEEDNNPQAEFSTKATPDPKLVAWMGFTDRLPSESSLNTQGLRQVSKEALWLLLHKDGADIWQEFVTSIETPGEGHANDVIVPFIKSAFCKKLADYQKQMKDSGTTIDEIRCEQLTFNITLVAISPTDLNGQPDLSYMTMIRSGKYVQLPDDSYSVEP